jgi:hypothetical protein
MLIPVVAFTAETRFPGLHALVPCLGAALFIGAFNRDGDRPVPLPARRIGLFIGKISYSLYLWHWPVFLLGSAAMPLAWTGSPLATMALLAVALLLACLSYRFVEAPPRLKENWAGLRLSGLIASAAIALVAICAVGVTANGFPTRYDQAEQRLLRYSIANMGPYYREHSCFLEPQDSFARYDATSCMNFAAGKINILLFGDSTAAHLVGALRQYLDPARYNLMQLNAAACAPFIGTPQPSLQNCDQANAAFAGILNDRRLSAVILSGHWSSYAEPGAPDATASAGTGLSTPLALHLGATLKATRDAGIPVLLLGPALEFPAPLAATLLRQQLTHVPVGDSFKVIPSAWTADTRIKMLAALYGNVQFVSMLAALCANGDCPLKADAETPMLWDTLHLTPEGAAYVVDRLRPELDLFLRKLHQLPDQVEKGPDATPSRVEATAGPPP